jgi:uncharacterized protein DUF998
MRRTVRSLAWLALGAQVLFIASWLVAGALQPGYSHARSGVSALAAHGAAHPWIVMAGLALLGLSAIALAPGLLAVLERRPAAVAAAALVALTGAAFLVTAFARMDCDLARHACYERFEHGALSWRTSAHLWAGVAASVVLVATPLALARALWPRVPGVLALLAGLFGLALGLLGEVAYRTSGTPDGTAERIELVAAQLWLVILAVGVLHETRGPVRYSAPTALRPRDFFGSTWRGEGQVQLRPFALTRRFAPSFAIARTTTWPAEDVGIVCDRAIFSDGHVEERRRIAHIIDPAHIHVSADDMPGGAEIVVDEAGYRIAPYRVLVPVGPVHLRVRCRDESHIEPDGTLVQVTRARWLGLPVARLIARVRAVDTAPAAYASTGAAST